MLFLPRIENEREWGVIMESLRRSFDEQEYDLRVWYCNTVEAHYKAFWLMEGKEG